MILNDALEEIPNKATGIDNPYPYPVTFDTIASHPILANIFSPNDTSSLEPEPFWRSKRYWPHWEPWTIQRQPSVRPFFLLLCATAFAFWGINISTTNHTRPQTPANGTKCCGDSNITTTYLLHLSKEFQSSQQSADTPERSYRITAVRMHSSVVYKSFQCSLEYAPAFPKTPYPDRNSSH